MHFRETYNHAMHGLKRVAGAVELGVNVYNGVRTAMAVGRAVAPYMLAAAV